MTVAPSAGQDRRLVVVVAGALVGQRQQHEDRDAVADQLVDAGAHRADVAALEQVADQHEHGVSRVG